MSNCIKAIGAALLIMTAIMAHASADEDGAPQTLFINVNIFDGVDGKLAMNRRVLVEGNLIKAIGDATLTGNEKATIIDGGGRTLMPGLIESHVHVNLQHMIGGYDTIEHRDWQEIGAMGAVTARALLMDGWTTIRDPGASLTGINAVIDRGELDGPRMYQATAVIGQTAGHGDFRLKGQRRLQDRYTFKGGVLGMTHIVDGYDATLSAARQNLANGAEFNKMMMGGGIFSSKDPLHSRQSTDDEIRAVVEASAAWGTYTTAHIYLPEHARRAIRLGLKEILHIPYLDIETGQADGGEKHLLQSATVSIDTGGAGSHFRPQGDDQQGQGAGHPEGDGGNGAHSQAGSRTDGNHHLRRRYCHPTRRPMPCAPAIMRCGSGRSISVIWQP